MIAERALLKEIMIYFAKGDITIRKFENSGDIAETFHSVQELLAQPEQEVYAKGYAEAMKQQVYEAYESGRKSALSEREPVAWGVYDPDSDMLISIYGYKERPDKVLKERFEWVKLYTAPPKREPLTPRQGLEEYKKGYARAEIDLKREPLSEDTVDKCLANAIKDGWYPVNEDSYRQGFWDAVESLEDGG